MLERSDCDSMESTIPQTTLWNNNPQKDGEGCGPAAAATTGLLLPLPSNPDIFDDSMDNKTIETVEESDDVSSIEESSSSKVGGQEGEEEEIPLSSHGSSSSSQNNDDSKEEEDEDNASTTRQDKSKVVEKYEENKGTANKQMRKITDQIEKLRMQLCKICHQDGSELSQVEKLKAENSFLSQVNEILHSRLYKAVSMLEVEEDYSLELEAKIEKLEATVKERDGVINKLSANAAASKSKSNKQREAAKTSSNKETNSKNKKRGGRDPYLAPSSTELFDKMDSMKGSKETTDVVIRPGMNGRRALFQRSESLGDLGEVENLGFHGAMASVLSGDGLDESERDGGNAKVSRRKPFFQRSSSLWDLSSNSDDDDDDKPKTDMDRSTKKNADKKPPLPPSIKRSDSIGSTSSSSSMMRGLKSKNKRRGKNEVDSASFHSTSSKNKGKKKMKDWRSGLSRCNSLSDLHADLDDSPASSSKKSKITSKSMKRSNSAEDLGTEQCSSPRESSSSRNKERSKSKGSAKGVLQLSSSHSNLSIGNTKGKSKSDPLGGSLHRNLSKSKGKAKRDPLGGSLHSSLSKSKKSHKGADKKIKFNGKRSNSVGDIDQAAREVTPATPSKEDEESSEALKYLLDDLWSKRKQGSSDNLAPMELKMGDSLNRLLKSNSVQSMPSNNKSLAAKPLPILKFGKTISNNDTTVEHPTKNAEWGDTAASHSSNAPFWPPRDLRLSRQLSKMKLAVPN